MSGRSRLPATDKSGYYEIRLESIGGLGANLAGKLLGELGALAMGANASSFSSYGSEKKGSPVRAYVRYREGEILRNSPVLNPHLLGIFHEAMAQAYPVFSGAGDETKIVFNSEMKPSEAAEAYDIPGGTLYCLDAGSIARDCGCRLNMVMLGALTAASGFLPVDRLEEICRQSVGKKYPELAEPNVKGVRSGFQAVSDQKGFQTGGGKAGTAVDNLVQSPAGCGLSGMAEPDAGRFPGWPGGVNPNAGNSRENNLAPGREGYIPVFHPERCIQCGLCDTTCPDMVFRFRPGVYKDREMMVNYGPDYQYCKGCLRCVNVCPVAALTKELEAKARSEGRISFDGTGKEV